MRDRDNRRDRDGQNRDREDRRDRQVNEKRD